MDGARRFRSQLGGYNKDDVNGYIKETDLKHAAEADALREEIAALRRELEEKETALETAASETAAAERSAAERVSELTAALESEKSAAEEARKNAEARQVEAESDLAAAGKKLEAVSADLLALRGEKEEADGRIASLTEELEKARAAAKDAERLRADLEASLRGGEEKDARIASLEDIAKQYEADSAEAAALRGKLADREKEIAELKAYVLREIDSLKASKEKEIGEFRAQKERELAARLAEMEEQKNREIEEQIAASRGSLDDKNSPAYKLDMYDRISGQLGNILLKANRSADEILSDAKSEAERIRSEVDLECVKKREDCDAAVEKIRAETEEEAAYIRDHLSHTASDLLSSVSSDLHGSMENCVRELTTCITDMEYEIKTMLTKLTERTDEMDGLITYYQHSVEEGIENKLRAMDVKYGIRPKDAEEAPEEDADAADEDAGELTLSKAGAVSGFRGRLRNGGKAERKSAPKGDAKNE